MPSRESKVCCHRLNESCQFFLPFKKGRMEVKFEPGHSMHHGPEGEEKGKKEISYSSS